MSPVFCASCVPEPVCDFCCFYRFNGDERGAYRNQGECVHPAHPHPEEPGGGCDDFHCVKATDAPAGHVAAHGAALRRPVL